MNSRKTCIQFPKCVGPVGVSVEFAGVTLQMGVWLSKWQSDLGSCDGGGHFHARDLPSPTQNKLTSSPASKQQHKENDGVGHAFSS